MRGLVEVMGDPQGDVPVVHVTGTNGKGSVTSMVAALLTAAGLRVGAYSSPHVDTIRERLTIDGQLISEEVFATPKKRTHKGTVPRVAEDTLRRLETYSPWRTTLNKFKDTLGVN